MRMTYGGSMSNQPKQIKERIIPHNMPEINTLEAYMYKIICLVTNKWYLGVHKENDKLYWHSSENDEFNKLWVNPTSKFKYEILEWGTYKHMTTREHEELKKVDAKNNPMSWNQSNGIPLGKRPPDYDTINKILDNIKNGEYSNVTLYKNKVETIKFKQSRLMQVISTRKISDIADAIDKELSTDKCDPLVLLEEYYPESGGSLGVGGNHTKEAFLKSKHAQHSPIDAILIPRKDYKNLTANELRLLGHGLNPNPDVEKTPTGVDDIVSELYKGQIQNGIDVFNTSTGRWNVDVKKYLVDTLKFKKSHLEKIKLGLKNIIKKNHQRMVAGLVFKTYGEGHYTDGSCKDTELEEYRKKYNTRGVTSLVEKSSSVTLGRIVSKANGNDTIHICIWHIDPNNEERWPTIKAGILKQLKWFDNSKKQIKFNEMDCWVSDIS